MSPLNSFSVKIAPKRHGHPCYNFSPFPLLNFFCLLSFLLLLLLLGYTVWAHVREVTLVAKTNVELDLQSNQQMSKMAQLSRDVKTTEENLKQEVTSLKVSLLNASDILENTIEEKTVLTINKTIGIQESFSVILGNTTDIIKSTIKENNETLEYSPERHTQSGRCTHETEINDGVCSGKH